jgi:hypothetical protein
MAENSAIERADFVPTDQSVEWVLEYGAVSAAVGESHRITCFEVHDDRAKAEAEGNASQYDFRVVPIDRAVAAEFRRLQAEEARLTKCCDVEYGMRHEALSLLDMERAKASLLLVTLARATEALAGGLWDYGPGQDEHAKCEELLAKFRAVLDEAMNWQVR